MVLPRLSVATYHIMVSSCVYFQTLLSTQLSDHNLNYNYFFKNLHTKSRKMMKKKLKCSSRKSNLELEWQTLWEPFGLLDSMQLRQGKFIREFSLNLIGDFTNFSCVNVTRNSILPLGQKLNYNYFFFEKFKIWPYNLEKLCRNLVHREAFSLLDSIRFRSGKFINR